MMAGTQTKVRAGKRQYPRGTVEYREGDFDIVKFPVLDIEAGRVYVVFEHGHVVGVYQDRVQAWDYGLPQSVKGVAHE